MPEKIFEATADEQDAALRSVTVQAESHGLDVSDPSVASFISHQASVIAALHADVRYRCSVINKMTHTGHG